LIDDFLFSGRGRGGDRKQANSEKRADDFHGYN
jgi:hypothetical protein